MSCQPDELNKLLLQADQDNIAFYESAIRNMQREVDALKYSSVSAAVAVRSSKHGTIFSGSTTADRLANAKTWLQKGSPTRYLRGVDTLLIELCASADSELTKHVSCGSVALRITNKDDLTRARTLDAIVQIIRIARKMMSRLQFGLLLHVRPDVLGCMLTPPRASLQATKRFATN